MMLQPTVRQSPSGRPRRPPLAIVPVLLGLGLALHAAGFRVRLGIEHGHLRQCWFGCESGATDKYDRRLDEMAPPPGFQTGYTAFISPDNRFYLYKDIRGFSKDITWRFQAQVYDHKPIVLHWDPKKLPPKYRFTVEYRGKKYDMAKIRELRIPTTAVLAIRAALRPPAPAATEAPQKP